MLKIIPNRLIVVGSVGFDYIMGMEPKFRDFIMPDMLDKLNVSFTVDSFQKADGGTGGNCCFGLGLMGETAYLVTTFGNDSQDYQERLKKVGVDLSLSETSHEFASAQGFVITDSGQNQIWGYYPGSMKNNKKINISRLTNNSDLIVMLPADPESYVMFIKKLVELRRNFVFDPAFFIANLPKEILLAGVQHARVVFGNEYEMELLQRKIGLEIAEWLSSGLIVVTTKGENGSEVQVGKNKFEIPAVKDVKVADPTGAGDAYRAGFLTGLMRGEIEVRCAQMGSVLASFALESIGTQSYNFSKKQFLDRLTENF
jgi:adenosine kinase